MSVTQMPSSRRERDTVGYFRSGIYDVWRVRLADAIAREMHRRVLTASDVAALAGLAGSGRAREDIAAIRQRLGRPAGSISEPGLKRLVRYAEGLGLDPDAILAGAADSRRAA